MPIAAINAMPLNLIGQVVLRDCTAWVYRVMAYIFDAWYPLSVGVGDGPGADPQTSAVWLVTGHWRER